MATGKGCCANDGRNYLLTFFASVGPDIAVWRKSSVAGVVVCGKVHFDTPTLFALELPKISYMGSWGSTKDVHTPHNNK